MTVDPAALIAAGPIEGTNSDRQARAIRKDRPVKTPPLELRTGVVTAVDVAGGTCTIRLGGSDVDVPDVIHVSNYRPHTGDAVKVLVQGKSMYVLDRTTNLGPSVIADAKGTSVTAEEFTTSTLYSPLGAGPNLPNVSVSPSGRLLVQLSALVYSQYAGTLALMGVMLFHNEMEFQVNPTALLSLATYSYSSSGLGVGASKVNLYTDLPAGNYGLTCYYASGGTSAGQPVYFSNRHLWALPL